MKELLVISGKGGSGKTSISSSFISLASDCVICDCDVEAPNLHILMHPESTSTDDFKGLPRAFIDQDKCIMCNLCTENCKFSSINDYIVSIDDCEGCCLCSRLCPVDAITMNEHICGQWFHSKTMYGTMFHANLGIGADNSGKLVSLLREKAREFAEEEKRDLIITDGPPGIGCPTIAALTGTDLAVIVVEPTLSAIHDMLRTIDLCSHFRIKHGVIINKADLNMEKTAEIKSLCTDKNIPVFADIPFDKNFRDAINNLQTPSSYSDKLHTIMENVWFSVEKALYEN